MFLRLDLARRKARPPSHAWQQLDYPSQSFDGIMLWGLIDYLDDREVRKLVDLCQDVLRPSGILLAAMATVPPPPSSSTSTIATTVAQAGQTKVKNAFLAGAS